MRPALFVLLVTAILGVAACGSRDRAAFEGEPASPAPESGGAASFGDDAGDSGAQPVCVDGDCERACAEAVAEKRPTGCDFYAPLPRTWVGFSANRFETSCYAAFVTNTFSRPVRLTLEHHDVSVDAKDHARIPTGSGQGVRYAPLPDGVLPPGEVAIVFLAGTSDAVVPCPAGVVPFVHERESECSNCLLGKDEAFRLRSSAPVAAADIFPYGGGESAVTAATSLLPVGAWGTDYIAVDAYDDQQGTSPWTTVVAKEDATEVRVTPRASLIGTKGFPGARPAGVETSYVLRKGQILRLQSVEGASLTGSPVVANKPVGAFIGHECVTIPRMANACDALHQTLPPIGATGSVYAVVRPRDRYAGVTEAPPVRVVGLVNDTNLTYAPAKPPGAPDVLARGETFEFRSSAPFVVSSQDPSHPFYVLTYMTGCSEYASPHDCRGDPELLVLASPDQFDTRASFFTDPTYPETHLVVVRARHNGVFDPVALDCAGDLTGWVDLGAFQYTRIDLVGGNFEKRGSCDNGRHDMSSTGRFGVAVWGWGSAATELASQFVSYAYLAGAGARALNSVPAVPR